MTVAPAGCVMRASPHPAKRNGEPLAGGDEAAKGLAGIVAAQKRAWNEKRQFTKAAQSTLNSPQDDTGGSGQRYPTPRSLDAWQNRDSSQIAPRLSPSPRIKREASEKSDDYVRLPRA